MKVPFKKGHYVKKIEIGVDTIDIDFVPRKKVALLFISLNEPYWPYVKQVIDDCKVHFLPQHKVDYFVWSDMPENQLTGVTVIPTDPVPWPTPTLMRYHLFLNEEEKLKDYDYIFYLDADMRVVQKISDEVLCNGLTAAEHPMYALRKEYVPPYEPNKESTAYIDRPGKVIDDNGKKRFKPYYYAGGFQGGTAKEFIKAMRVMKENIDKDFNKNYTAIWNDECLAKGTLVTTKKGDIPIENIKAGDLVLTRKGYKKVLKTLYQGRKKVINRIGIWATPDHPFITLESVKHFAKLEKSDKLYVCEGNNILGKSVEELNQDFRNGLFSYELLEMDILDEIKAQNNHLNESEHEQIMVSFKRLFSATFPLSKRLTDEESPSNRQDFWEWAAYKIIKYGFETDVYDLTIEDEHEFFANGILVHNSHWNKYLSEYKGETVVLSPSYIYPDSLIKEYYEPAWGCSYEPKIITLTKPFSLSKEGGQHLNEMLGLQSAQPAYECPTCKNTFQYPGHKVVGVVACPGSGKPHEIQMVKI